MAKHATGASERAGMLQFGWLWMILAAACDNAAPAETPLPNVTAPAAGATAGTTSSASAGRTAPPTPPASTNGGSAAGAGSPALASAGSPAAAGASAGRSAAAGSGGAGAAGSAATGGAGAPAASGGSGGGAAGSAGSAGATAPAVKPPCLKKPSQLVALGDSYLNWITHTFPEDFEKEFGGKYRMYAVGAASMGSGGITGLIPDQLTAAVQEDPDIIASVLTGGGNDILIADAVKYPGSDTCKDRTDSPSVKACQDVVSNALAAAGKLMKTAADAGVRDVIYIYYPHIPGGGFGGMNPNVLLDYSMPMARDLCEQAEANTAGKLRCYFLPLQPIFEGHTEWFADDGIHENSAGSAVMAKETVKLLKEKCIAQPESSGCCAP